MANAKRCIVVIRFANGGAASANGGAMQYWWSCSCGSSGPGEVSVLLAAREALQHSLDDGLSPEQRRRKRHSHIGTGACSDCADVDAGPVVVGGSVK